MARFDGASKLAQRLIKKNGQAAVLRRFPPASPADSDRPWRRSKSTPTGEDVNAVFLNFGDLGRAGEQYMAGTEVAKGDKLVLIPGADLTEPPTLSDRIYRDGGGEDDEGWSIVKVETLDPNGQQVLHQLQVRR